MHRTNYDFPTQVKDYNEIVSLDLKKYNMRNGLRFVKLKCVSPEDAIRRCLIVALITYQRKKRCYVKLLSKGLLASSMALKDLQMQWELSGTSDQSSMYLGFLLKSGPTDYEL
jgi:hypothetical protein